MIKHVLGITALVLTLSACGEVPQSSTKNARTPSKPMGITVESIRGGASYSTLGTWIDPATGCEYITGEVSGGIFMTPKIGSDQMPVCDKARSTDFETYNRLKKQFGE
jgi:hypothetical protein